MARKRATVVVTGMSRDMAKGRFDPQFSFENRNIRVTPRDAACTSFSVTNERGTEWIDAYVYGTPVGSFACDEYFGIFSYLYDEGVKKTLDYITVYKYSDGSAAEYFRWRGEGLGFKDVDTSRQAIEAEASVEAENSVRVYWVDGIHQMRVIDFIRLRSKYGEFIDDAVHDTLGADYFSYLPKPPSVKDVSVTTGGNGAFRSGTVQLFVTFVINGNESNIAWSSPLYYCHNVSDGKAFAPDATTGGDNFVLSFRTGSFSVRDHLPIDFARVYAVHRSTRDGAPVAYAQDVAVGDYTHSVTVTANMTGAEEAADPDSILMLNSRLVTGQRAICQKDGLLFIGGLTYSGASRVKEVKADVSVVRTSRKRLDVDEFNGKMATHASQLSLDSFAIGHFKSHEKYALGIQVMDEYGHWGDPIPVNGSAGDCLHEMTEAPKTMPGDSHIWLPSFKAVIDAAELGDGVKAVRPVVAYLDDTQKRCLYQGFITPTIYCEKERAEGQVYAKLSPFARTMKYWGAAAAYHPEWSAVNPLYVVSEGAREGEAFTLNSNMFFKDPVIGGTSVWTAMGYQMTAAGVAGWSGSSAAGGTYPASQHLAALGCTHDYNCELQSSWYYRDVAFKSALIPSSGDGGDDVGNDDDSDSAPVANQGAADVCTNNNAGYFVDANAVTLHSPDLTAATTLTGSGEAVIVGAVPMRGFASDTSIVASTPKLSNSDVYSGKPGFQHLSVGSATGEGRCAMNLPNWAGAFSSDDKDDMAHYWGVPPFGVDDFLNAEDGQANDGERVTSKLTYRQLANYRFSAMSEYFADAKPHYWGDGGFDMKAVDGTEAVIERLGDDGKLYKPAEDVVVAPPVNSMWTNGPYYARGVAPSEALGVKSVSKFNCRDLSWQWAMYATIWLRRRLDFGPAWYNYVNLNSLVYSSGSLSGGDKSYTPGYWAHGGTAEGAELTYGGGVISGKKRGDYRRLQCDYLFNYRDDGDDKLVNLGDEKSGHVKFQPKHRPKSYTVRLKYCSTPHAVLIAKGGAPMPNYGALARYACKQCDRLGASLYMGKGWKGGDELARVGDSDLGATEEKYDINTAGWDNRALPAGDADRRDSLWVMDVINNCGEPKFDKAAARWVVAGEAVEVGGADVEVDWLQGDWYYQRWDCLRAYPKSVEDKCQVVEIVSVMLETRRNIDGRYDSHAGEPFLQANPNNFCLINDSYTQENNFFSFTTPSDTDNVVESFPCQVAWSMPKSRNANIDAWTSFGALSLMDMDGGAGPVTKLALFAGNVYCFQPSAISIIPYNSRTQVTAEDGMPVELAASKIVGPKYTLTDKRGAASNLAVTLTDSAIYFADELNRTLCALTQNIASLTDSLGFHSWARSLPSFAFRVFAEPGTGSVLFDRVGGDGDALSYNERCQRFESFIDVGGSVVTLNARGDTLAIHKDDLDNQGEYRMWRLGTGERNRFYGLNRPYWVDCLISGEGVTDKVFDVVEFSGDVTVDGTLSPMRCPYNLIRAYNEYQDSGWVRLDFKRFSASASKNLFRLWRAFVPRDASKRRPGKVAERMRNPWCHIALKYDPSLEEDPYRRNDMAELQEINVDYNEE